MRTKPTRSVLAVFPARVFPARVFSALSVVTALVVVAVIVAATAAWAESPAPDVVKAAIEAVDGCAESPPPAGFAEELKQKLKVALESGNVLWALVLVLLAGFGVTLTPCVYPLIPITLSLFGARSVSSKLTGFFLSSTYVGGMVLLYSALGIGFALAGKVMGAAMQNPVVTIGVALLCLTMAASMFGAFELALPSSLQQRLTQVGGSGFKGAFLMGLVAGLIAAPCTGPVLSFILTLIAKDGDVMKGALFMLVFSVGMGIPFIVLGTFSSAISRIPKTGAWTEAVKSVFGLLMIGAGLYFLAIGVPAVGELLGRVGELGLLLAPVLVVGGALIGALHLSFKYTSPREKTKKAVGLVLACAGVAAFLGWTESDSAPSSSSEGGAAAKAVAWSKVDHQSGALARFDALLASAKSEGKPVMIDFYADWCAACKELDKHTYSDGAVREEAQRFASVKIDATEDTEELQEIQRRFGVVGLPTVAFLSSRGVTCPSPRITGFVDPGEYLPLMRGVR